MTEIVIEDARDTPGNVQLIDEDGHLKTKHAGTGQKDIVLIPTPSDDPEDPLNWSFRRKILATSCIVMYTLMVTFPSSAVYSVTTPISKETSLSINDLISGNGAMFLLAGWGCIPWQAIALQYGKRPCYLASLLGGVIVMATAPLCVTRGPYFASKIAQGIITAPVESLCEISVTDIWFAHQRPRYLAVYGFSLAFAGKIAPCFAGFINDKMNWKWTLWWCAIGCGVAFVYCFFLMEETNYDRNLQPAMQISSTSYTTNPESTNEFEEKAMDETPRPNVEAGSVIYNRKTYWQKLSLMDKKRENRMLSIMAGPFRFFTYPVVVYAGLMYGANGLVWSSVLNATAGTLYPQQYGFSTSGVAYAYLGGVLGVVVGAVYCGKIGEWIVIRLAKRNKGISEPEHILWIFMASLILVPFSLLLWGLVGTYHGHWFGLVFAQFTLSISNAISAPVALSYAISSYRDMGGELVTTTILIRNTMNFAINYGITPWIAAQGFRNTFITVACIGLVWNSSIFVMIKYGKTLRKKSAARYWKYVDYARAHGLSH